MKLVYEHSRVCNHLQVLWPTSVAVLFEVGIRVGCVKPVSPPLEVNICHALTFDLQRIEQDKHTPASQNKGVFSSPKSGFQLFRHP